MTNSDLLTLPAMARQLRVTQAWLREQVQSGQLPALDAGGRLLFNVAAVERVLCERAAATPVSRAEVTP